MNYFDIVYSRLIEMLSPVLLRKRRWLAWMNILITPTKWLYDVFTVNRLANVYFVNHTSQVYSMEAVLNDTFDSEARRIYITDRSYPEYVWLFIALELRPLPLYLGSEGNPVPLFTAAEVIAADSADVFIVNIPEAVTLAAGYSEARVRAVVEQYRLPSMSAYSIVIF